MFICNLRFLDGLKGSEKRSAQLVFLLLISILIASNNGWCEWYPWETPPEQPKPIEVRETNILRLFFQETLEQFQTRISPIDGPRCNFMPTCSEYARQSIAHYGLARGIIMASDRLQRCNYCAVNHYPLQGRRLFDPPEANFFNHASEKE